MNVVSFDLIKWQALSKGISCPADWQSWVECGKSWDGIEGKLLVDKIPPVVRRRMSFVSKLAVQNALMLTENNDVNYIIFSSRHGELTRTASLLNSILSGDDASPTAFSQSVHNTAASHYIIIGKKRVPVVSLGFGINSLSAAMVEASAYLKLHPSHNVLLVDFDEPVVAPYDRLVSDYHPGYSLGLLITGGKSVRMELFESSLAEPAAFGVIESLLNYSGGNETLNLGCF